MWYKDHHSFFIPNSLLVEGYYKYSCYEHLIDRFVQSILLIPIIHHKNQGKMYLISWTFPKGIIWDVRQKCNKIILQVLYFSMISGFPVIKSLLLRVVKRDFPISIFMTFNFIPSQHSKGWWGGMCRFFNMLICLS